MMGYRTVLMRAFDGLPPVDPQIHVCPCGRGLPSGQFEAHQKICPVLKTREPAL